MGLDMYLSAKLYTSAYSNKEAHETLRALPLAWPCEIADGGDLQSISIEIQVAYWRKANQIHKWFVVNAQDGTDDCKSYDVSRDQLAELRDLCRELLASKDVDQAKDKLPTEGGFFFGSTDYDEYFWEDIAETDRQLSDVLARTEADPYRWDFSYQSSW